MPTERDLRNAELKKRSEDMVAALRATWLTQVLGWPLTGGPLIGRVTEAEVEVLREAAQQGKIFVGLDKTAPRSEPEKL